MATKFWKKHFLCIICIDIFEFVVAKVLDKKKSQRTNSQKNEPFFIIVTNFDETR